MPRTQLRFGGTWRASSVIDPVTAQTRQIGGFYHLLGDFALIHDVPKWGSTFTLSAQPIGYTQWTYRLNETRQEHRPVITRFFWNWTISKQWLFRLEVYNLLPKLATRDRYLYAPTRAGALTQREYRRMWGDPVATIRLRRSF